MIIVHRKIVFIKIVLAVEWKFIIQFIIYIYPMINILNSYKNKFW